MISLGDAPVPDLQPYPAAELVSHLRPAHARRVDPVAEYERDGCLIKELLISSYQHDGGEVWMSLRLCLGDRTSRDLVLSLPGGHGVFRPDLHLWLGRHFRKNYAVIDWIGRGKSPAHETIKCEFDPILLLGESFRESFLFHNLSSIWGAADWLVCEGFTIATIVGTSWGGVQALLMAAIEPRISTVLASFGCGGFSIPGIEKRSYWDDAFAHMGPRRVAEWCRAFDPYLRMGQVEAEVNFETAANDKFFSMDMAMRTWREVRRKGLLRIEPNQDHTIEPMGAQSYWVEDLSADPTVAKLKSFSAAAAAWSMANDQVIYSGGESDETGRIELVSSAQLPGRGNMSRDWIVSPPGAAGGALAFALPACPSIAQQLAYACERTMVGRVEICASTPIWLVEPGRSPASASPMDGSSVILSADREALWLAPIGDRMSPSVKVEGGGWKISFTGDRLSRVARYGIRPWELPSEWRELAVIVGEPLTSDQLSLQMVLSRRYNRFDEEAVSAPFDSAELAETPAGWEYRFAPGHFSPVDVRHSRFGRQPERVAGGVETTFDAVGIIDPTSGRPSDMLLNSIELRI